MEGKATRYGRRPAYHSTDRGAYGQEAQTNVVSGEVIIYWLDFYDESDADALQRCP